MSKKIKPPDTFSSRGKPVTLDWKAYFLEFCKVHGEPVQQCGRLLFRDGWTYSSTAYEGPEFPPPLDLGELDVLVREYWTIRRTALFKLMNQLLEQQNNLKKLEASHSMPLQQMTTQSENGQKRRGYKPLNTESLELHIDWVSDDLKECNERLREIEEYHKVREIG